MSEIDLTIPDVGFLGRVPKERIRIANDKPLKSDGSFVLYWMITARRLSYNFALDRAVEWAKKLKKPLVILEALRCNYPWASDRIHQFVINGMAHHDEELREGTVTYFPFLEQHVGYGKGLLETFAKHSCVVLTDEFPCFFIPKMTQKAATKISVLLEVIDSNGLLPLACCDREFSAAYHFRRFLQKKLPEHLEHFPKADPFKGVVLKKLKKLPQEITEKWSRVDSTILQKPNQLIQSLPIDHHVKALSLKGGAAAADEQLKKFLANLLDGYDVNRNEPECDATSNLSSYLHFGHISSHKIFKLLMKKEHWEPSRISSKSNGRRQGWWGCSVSSEAFLDQFITWRELGYAFCSQRKDYDHYDSLPNWAKKTLAEHAKDPRPYVYELEEFEQAQTHDPLWNAAQRQLVSEGKIHNYLRMLWGKKILHWSASPQEALEIMIELNNKYSIDGRNPNSYSGICWCLGRFDRPWGPERAVFGKVRYMTSENTTRKFKVDGYIKKFAQ